MSKFRITDKKGFHVSFANGYTVSVQFGPGNYCDNYDRRIRNDDEISGQDGSNTAELAVFSPERKLIPLPGRDGDNVAGYQTPEKMLELMNWAASLKSE